MTTAANAPLVPRGLVPGVVVLLIGAIFLADSLGMLNAHTGWAMWPVAVIVAGIVVQLQPSTANRFTGIILVVAGIWLLCNGLGIWTYAFWRTWPAILILMGVWMGYRTWHMRRLAGGAAGYDMPTTKAEHVGAFVFLSQVTRRTDGQTLRTGELSTIAGDCFFDFGNASRTAEPIVVDAFALGGRIRVAVPALWSVDMRVLPLLARAVDARVSPTATTAGATRRDLIVQGTAILGVVEVVASATSSPALPPA